MTYSIKTAGKDDAEDLVTIMQTAFADHHIMPYMHKDVPQDLQFQDDLDLFREWLAEGDIYGARFTKAIDNDTGYGQSRTDGHKGRRRRMTRL